MTMCFFYFDNGTNFLKVTPWHMHKWHITILKCNFLSILITKDLKILIEDLMKFMKRAFGEFHKIQMKWPRV